MIISIKKHTILFVPEHGDTVAFVVAVIVGSSMSCRHLFHRCFHVLIPGGCQCSGLLKQKCAQIRESVRRRTVVVAVVEGKRDFCHLMLVRQFLNGVGSEEKVGLNKNTVFLELTINLK